MHPYTLTDLDELVLTVRNTNSRAYINDAVQAHRSHLNRAAVILTWTAVAYDLVSKYRELSEQGEGAATQIVKDLDTAIEKHDVLALQGIENKLLEFARANFEIIDQNEQAGLERLKEDRNLCAHPAFTGENVLFDPLPEQVRAHIVHAVSAVLQNPPVQGKAAFGRLKADLLQPSFPTSEQHVRVFLANRYFNRMKRSLTAKLVVILAKEIILRPDPELATVPENVVRALMALAEAYPADYETHLKDVLPRYAAGAEDEKLWRFLLIVGNDSRVWTWLDEPTRIRLVSLINSGKVKGDEIGYLALAFKVPELESILRARFELLEDEKKERFIAAIPVAELSDEAIRIFSESNGWRTAEARAKNLIVPLAQSFTADQVDRILDATLKNDQIWDAAEIPEILANLFRLTHHLLPATAPRWKAFLENVDKQRPGGYRNKIWAQLEGG